MKIKSTFLLILFTLLFFNLSAQFSIGHRTFSFLDPDRANREVTGEIYYPADMDGDNVVLANGEFPLIVFGHGLGMAWSEYSVWWEALVPKGYIVAFPTTETSVIPFPSHAEYGTDMDFVLKTYMSENADANSDFFQKLTGKNALMGHSMGGGCSYLASGTNAADVETIITMAAADTDPSAITASANISIPVLTLAGSEDCVVMAGGTPVDIYGGLTASSYKAYVEITGASHCQFGIASTGSICTIGEFACAGSAMPIADQHNQMLSSAMPWLDFFLKDQCSRWFDFQNHLYNGTGHTYQESGMITLPIALPSISGETAFCPGGNSTLDAGAGYDAYIWSDGSTAQTLGVSTGGDYTVTVSEAGGCSATAVVTITENPEPTVTISDNMTPLTSSVSGGNTFTYQWFHNGNPLANETSPEIDPNLWGNGDYYLEVTNEFGCTGISNTINFIVESTTSIGNPDFGIKIYPTVFENEIHLEFISDKYLETEIRLMDLSGKQVRFQLENIVPGEIKTLQLNHLSAGIYVLTVKSSEGMFTSKICKK